MRAVNDLDRQAMDVLTGAASQIRELTRGVTDRAAVTRLEAAMNGLDADRRFLEQGGAATPRAIKDPAERLRILEAQEAERARSHQLRSPSRRTMAARNSAMPSPLRDDVTRISGNAAGCFFSAADVSAVRASSSAGLT